MKYLIMLAASMLLFSCASQKAGKNDPNISVQTIKTKIKKGVTTKAQVIELLGSPEMVNIHSTEEEQWVYSKHQDESNWNNKNVSGGLFDYISDKYVGLNIDLGSSNSKYTSKSTNTTLYIYFDNKGIVYSFDYSNNKS